jgi:hypothetical protein
MPRGQGPFARRPSSWRALSRRECALLEAWDAEAEGNPWSVLEAWENLAAELAAEQRPEGPKDPRSRLEIALVLRRAEAHFKLLEIEQPDEDPESPETLAAEQLERSLLWDPEHRETYLGLITWYRRARRLRDARRLLAQAQQRWPQDMTVLEAALETALASNAFKKAVGIARQMLAIDPINSSARRRLVDAHIEHAAKQVPKARAALARKELAEARAWAERGAGLEPVRHQLALLDGLVVLALIDPGEGKASLTELLEQRGDGVVAQLELMLAADRLALRQSDIAERLALAQRKPGNRDELLAVLTLLRTYLERTNGYTYGLMDRLGTMLSGAPWKQLECGELELACETLRAFRLPTIRQAAARAGLKRWPRTPMLEYHLYDARFAEGGFPSAAELEKMERALARAEAAGDMRAAERLRGLVHQYLPFGRMPAPPFFDDPAPPAREPDELGDLEGSTGLDLLMDALDQLPLKQALDATGMPRHLKRQVLKVARDAGEEVAVEMLKAIVRSAAAEAGDSPLPKRQPRSMPTGGRGGAPANDQEETDNPRQFDLF